MLTIFVMCTLIFHICVRILNIFLCVRIMLNLNKLTFKTSCNEDILPSGLGDRGNDGGWSRGLTGAMRFVPTTTPKITHVFMFTKCSYVLMC